MTLRALPPALAASLTLAVAGCGGSADPGASSRAIADAGSTRASAPLRLGITQGRTGDATTAADARPLRALDSGRRIDPRAARDGARRRAGVGAGAACENADLTPAAENLDAVAVATLCLLNGERADHGLGPVTENARLAQAAAAHSRDMVANSYFAHEALDGSTIVDRVRVAGYLQGTDGWTVGENLAWGTGALATPRAIVQAWMDSPGHRDNVLRARFREIGLGVIIGTPRDASTGATYTTAFGGRDGADATADDAGTSGSDASDADATASARRSAVAAARRSSCRRLARAARRLSAKGLARSAKARRRAAKRCRARVARYVRQ